jgi:hypothetical protein
MLDLEDWKIVLEVYKGHPILALGLAQQLTAIRQSLESGRKGIPDAIDALNLAIDGLFDHTDFNKVSRKLYSQRLEETLRPKQEEKLRELGEALMSQVKSLRCVYNFISARIAYLAINSGAI